MKFRSKNIVFPILILFFIITQFRANAQQETIDSLKKVIQQKQRGEKVQALNRLSRAYWNISADSSLKYSKMALSLAQQINDDKGISDALNRIGNAYYFLGDYDKALSYYENCLELRKKLNDYKRLNQIYNNLAVYYSNQGEFDKAEEYYKLALKLSQKHEDKEEEALYHQRLAEIYSDLNQYDKAIEYYYNAEKIFKALEDNISLGYIYNSKSAIYKDISSYDKALKASLTALDYHKLANNLQGVSFSYNSIGIINQTLKNYDKALEYYNKMIEILKELDNRQDMAVAYNNIGIVYDEKDENKKALDYYQRAYEIHKGFNYSPGMSSSLNNIGLIHFELEEYNKALDYLQQSINLSKERKDKLSMANTYNNMGEVLIHLEKYNEALGKIDTAINLAKEVQSKEYRDESYRLFSLLYERMGNFDKALQYHKLHTKLNDTIFSREKQNRISEIQIKYETEKKEKEIELLKEAHELKVKRQRTIIISIIIVIAMLLIVVGLIYNQFRLKKKNTKILQEKNDQLEKTNKKLKESEQNLRELNATKDKFFSIISHDLKNPFQALFGFAEAMYNNISQFNTEEIKEYSKAIYESSQNLYNLLENLLQWSRSQLGSIQLSPQKLDINDSLNDIINLLSINAEEKDIDLNNKLAEETTAFVDENVFSTVMRNLLNNSIKFTEKGGKVDIYSRLENSHVVISVSDTGQGISEENMDKLFRIDKNLSTKGTHNEPGTGLGLILCKELIEKSDGKIWVKSKEGKGSVFEFSLPAGTAK